jgi:hypothetical protein
MDERGEDLARGCRRKLLTTKVEETEIAVAKGSKRAYLVEVFTAANAAPERVREAQVALNSFRLEG